MPAGGSRQHGWQPCIRYGGSGGAGPAPTSPYQGRTNRISVFPVTLQAAKLLYESRDQ